MKRIIAGLHQASTSTADNIQDGIFLVRIVRADYRWHKQKPYY